MRTLDTCHHRGDVVQSKPARDGSGGGVNTEEEGMALSECDLMAYTREKRCTNIAYHMVSIQHALVSGKWSSAV